MKDEGCARESESTRKKNDTVSGCSIYVYYYRLLFAPLSREIEV